VLHLPSLLSFQRSNIEEAEKVQKLHEIVCSIPMVGFVVQISVSQRKIETSGIKAVSNDFLPVCCQRF